MKSELEKIPGVGPSIARNLQDIGIELIQDLIGRNPEELYEQSNLLVGTRQDPCLLYVFRCAVYYANTAPEEREPEKLKWWNWKN